MAEPSASRLTHRFRVNQGLVAFEDVHRGPVAEDVAREVGDFIVLRSEGYFAYHLAVVVDDALQGVTDIVRGGDLLLATPRQILLQRALGFPTPRYLHLPVATHATGAKLSKQTHATPLVSSCASKNLARALLALGQSLPGAIASTDAAIEALRDKPPWEILEEAQVLWNPSKLPSATSFVLSDGS
jgi:glutamyl-Q tRNA(Asp) synthetase